MNTGKLCFARATGPEGILLLHPSLSVTHFGLRLTLPSLQCYCPKPNRDKEGDRNDCVVDGQTEGAVSDGDLE
jgi:hypothetical protein